MRYPTIPVPFPLALTLALSVVLALAAAAPGGADGLSSTCTTCEIYINPGTESVTPPLGLMLNGSPGPVSTAVAVPPDFGTWDGTTYTPGPDFWTAGGDRVSLVPAGFGSRGIPWHLVFVPTVPLIEDGYTEDFDGAGGSLAGLHTDWTQLGNGAQVWLSNEAPGAWRLSTVAGGGLSRRVIDSSTPNGTDQMGGDALVNLDPPDDQVPPANMQAPFALLQFRNTAGIPIATAETRAVDGNYWIRGRFHHGTFGCLPHCHTPWRSVPASTDLIVRIRYGTLAWGTAFEHTGLLFAVDGPNVSHVDRLPSQNGGPTTADLVLGGLGIQGGGAPPLLEFDDLTASFTRFGIPAAPRVVDFESGTWPTPWTADGPMRVVASGGGMSGGLTSAARPADLGSNSKVSIARSLPTPPERLAVSFLLDLRDADLAHLESYTILSAGTDGPNPQPAFILQIRHLWQGTHVRAIALQSSGFPVASPWLDVPNSTVVPIHVRWHSGAPGRLDLWADGQSASITGLVNAARSAERIELGLWDRHGPSVVEGVVPRQVDFDLVTIY